MFCKDCRLKEIISKHCCKASQAKQLIDYSRIRELMSIELIALFTNINAVLMFIKAMHASII